MYEIANSQYNTTLFSSVDENLLQNSPNIFAISTFFASPITNLLAPYAKFSKLCFLLESSSSIVSYLTIGPAISCGNKATYVAKFKKFL